MKKVVIFLLMVGIMVAPAYCFAQSREASGVTLAQTRTNLTALGLMGQNVVGNPGYLAMVGVAIDATSYVPEYYLWVKADGDLCMASGPTIENYSDFPNGDWENLDGACTVVGGQT